jgi:hypothetical protein
MEHRSDDIFNPSAARLPPHWLLEPPSQAKPMSRTLGREQSLPKRLNIAAGQFEALLPD